MTLERGAPAVRRQSTSGCSLRKAPGGLHRRPVDALRADDRRRRHAQRLCASREVERCSSFGRHGRAWRLWPRRPATCAPRASRRRSCSSEPRRGCPCGSTACAGCRACLASERQDIEPWGTDRTGHKSSQMLALDTRQARTWAELAPGPLRPFDELLPEMKPSTPAVRGSRRRQDSPRCPPPAAGGRVIGPRSRR